MDKQQRIDELERDEGGGLVFQFAHLILPYLEPASLASVSATCKALHAVSKAITSRRISDASRNLEKYPIPFSNSIDSELYAYFIYTPVQILPTTSPYQCWGGSDTASLDRVRPDPFLIRLEDAHGCECESCNLDCTCMRLNQSQECGPSCRCGLECRNRVTQRGASAKLKILKDRRKGWSLCAAEFIPKDKFICEYTGELLTTGEARKRQKLYDNSQLSAALLVVREHLPSRNACMRINIDATRIGNVARFINHSCDGGNLCTTIMRGCGALLPRVCFFASRDILEDEELTFCYGETNEVSRPTASRCYCGSACCRGILPSEHT